MKIYAWLSDEENAEMNRAENPQIYKILDKALTKRRAQKKKLV